MTATCSIVSTSLSSGPIVYHPLGGQAPVGKRSATCGLLERGCESSTVFRALAIHFGPLLRQGPPRSEIQGLLYKLGGKAIERDKRPPVAIQPLTDRQPL